MFFGYRIVSFWYKTAIYIASLFSVKAKMAVMGRRNYFKILPDKSGDQFIWFHCASLGEFEQGKPIMEMIKSKDPQTKILLTFFSPSGYELCKNYATADVVTYLPFDGPQNARKFLAKYSIQKAVFIKYDLWPFYIRELLENNIPTYLVSAVFRRSGFYFKWYGEFMLKMLKGFSKILVQNTESLKLADKHGLKNVILSGDTRVDSVLENKNSSWHNQAIELFTQDGRVAVFGSVWPEDEKVINDFLCNSDVKVIIAPHSVNQNYVNNLKNKFPDSILLSEGYLPRAKILIIDHVGSLKYLYRLANVAYIGGGFGTGIHNILEPAVYGIPVVFGPKYFKFPEAVSMMEDGLAFSHNASSELAKTLMSLLRNDSNANFEEISRNWFQKHQGAAQITYNEIVGKIQQ